MKIWRRMIIGYLLGIFYLNAAQAMSCFATCRRHVNDPLNVTLYVPASNSSDGTQLLQAQCNRYCTISARNSGACKLYDVNCRDEPSSGNPIPPGGGNTEKAYWTCQGVCKTLCNGTVLSKGDGRYQGDAMAQLQNNCRSETFGCNNTPEYRTYTLSNTYCY